jgi:hypothetical protein
MKLIKSASAVCAGLAVVLLTATAAMADKPPQSWDGLELTKRKGLDLVYIRPDVQFKAYKDVMIDRLEVAFDKNWDPNRNVRGTSGRLSTEDMQRIKDNMATEFQKVFVEELGKGGYAVVDKMGDDTLRVSPGLANVYINAPDTSMSTPGRSTTYTTQGAGRMTLVMELRDAPTGQLLARVIDTKAGTDTGWAQVTNSVTNSADFRRAVRAWAQRLVKGLDTVNGKTTK